MNPRNVQSARSPLNRRMETGSSSKPKEIGSETSNLLMDSFSSFNQPRLQHTITNPHTKDTYLLNVQIGSFSNGQYNVYRALFSRYSEEDGVPIPSGYVTLKILNINHPEFSLIRRQCIEPITHNHNIIGSNRSFIAANLFCVSLPYMSQGSLRSILSTRPDKKLPEDLISVVLKEVVIGLRDEIHVESNPRVHKTLNAGDIFVNIDNATQEMSIKLAFEVSVYDSEPPNRNRREASSSSLFLNPKSISAWGAAPEVFENANANNNLGPKSDIWLLGITALELAYGNLPVKNRRDLDYIITKIRETKKFPKSLEKMMSKRNGKLKKVMDFVKRKKRAFSKEFEEMVVACLAQNPVNRPTADQLLNTPFFSVSERFKQFVLNANN